MDRCRYVGVAIDLRQFLSFRRLDLLVLAVGADDDSLAIVWRF